MQRKTWRWIAFVAFVLNMAGLVAFDGWVFLIGIAASIFGVYWFGEKE